MYRTRKTEKRYALQRKQAKAAGIRCDFCEFTSTHPQVKEEFSHFWVARNNFPYSVWDGCDVADHVMIVPKRHIEGVHVFTAAERQEFINIIAAYEVRGYSFYARPPKSTQKSVAHQHTHLIKNYGKTKKVQFSVEKPYILLAK